MAFCRCVVKILDSFTFIRSQRSRIKGVYCYSAFCCTKINLLAAPQTYNFIRGVCLQSSVSSLPEKVNSQQTNGLARRLNIALSHMISMSYLESSFFFPFEKGGRVDLQIYQRLTRIWKIVRIFLYINFSFSSALFGSKWLTYQVWYDAIKKGNGY